MEMLGNASTRIDEPDLQHHEVGRERTSARRSLQNIADLHRAGPVMAAPVAGHLGRIIMADALRQGSLGSPALGIGGSGHKRQDEGQCDELPVHYFSPSIDSVE